MTSLKFKHRIYELTERSKYIDITSDKEYKYKGNEQHALGFMFSSGVCVELFEAEASDRIRSAHIIEPESYNDLRAIGLAELYDIDIIKLGDLDIIVFKEDQVGYKRVTRIYSNGEWESFRYRI